jgi:aryl-alcohol dehydrogenase-like predicted oxidoreductase
MSFAYTGAGSDHKESIRTIHRALDLGVTLIDTAEFYGPYTNEELLGRALKGRRDQAVIATKFGMISHTGRGSGQLDSSPTSIRTSVEGSLRRLDTDHIDLYYQHRVDPDTPIEDTMGALADLVTEGKIRHIGLSEVDVEQLKEAQKTAEIVSVQNLYNLANRDAEDLLDHCTDQGIGFIPWFPLATGELSKDDGPLAEAAEQHDATPSQLALAWLLKRSPVMLPIPGTSSVDHLESNTAGAGIELTDEEFAALGEAAQQEAA